MLVVVLAGMLVGPLHGGEPGPAAVEDLAAEDGAVRAQAAVALEAELARLEKAGDAKELAALMAPLRAVCGSPDAEQAAAARQLLAPYLAGGRRWECELREGWQAAFTDDGVLVFDRRGATAPLVSLLDARTGGTVWSFKPKQLNLSPVPTHIKGRGTEVFLGVRASIGQETSPVWSLRHPEETPRWKEHPKGILQVMELSEAGLLLGRPPEEKPGDELNLLAGWDIDFFLREPSDGTTLWTASLKFLSGAIAVPCEGGFLVAGMRTDQDLENARGWMGFLDAKTGKLLWEKTLEGFPERIGRTPAGVLFACAPAGDKRTLGLLAFDGPPRQGGVVAWTVQVPVVDPSQGFCRCLPNGILIGEPKGLSGGGLTQEWEIALYGAKDGAPAWKQRVELPRYDIIDIGPQGILFKRALDRNPVLTQIETKVALGVFRYKDADKE